MGARGSDRSRPQAGPHANAGRGASGFTKSLEFPAHSATAKPAQSTNVERPFNSQGRAPRDNKPLHPSWEAKKRMKEKQTAAILPSQGTRMVFD